ncbi:MAG: right-handed parallel beta-helix repeat-containing protein, partial [Planctomycetes bacterium]|nr:right-handed parallel beta-helix repeat-containing protein [Planctomycetota bacterium]
MITKNNVIIIGMISLSIFLHSEGTAVGNILYVDDDAVGANDGNSWNNAYKYLQDALVAAMAGDEIRVAQGVYRPDKGNSHIPGDREATFRLKKGVKIMGGYAGFGEPNLNARNIQEYETILSGDLNGDDGPDFLNNGENSYHVVTGSGTDTTAILDGVTTTAGNANGAFPENGGGGMLNMNGHPTVNNCIFTENSAGWAGGMYNEESNPTVTNCRFVDNSAESDGGGMRNENSSPTLTGCIFSSNSATNDGGGMENVQSSPILADCTFSSNSVTHDGGGMDNWESSNPTLTGCTFSSNSATNGGGGMSNWESNPTVTNCRFVDNSAESDGGGMRNENSNPTLTGCTFSSNSATNDGGGMENVQSSPILADCTFSSNSVTHDG